MTPKVKPSDLIKMSEAYGYLFGAPMNFKSVSEMAEFIQSIPMEMNDLISCAVKPAPFHGGDIRR